MFGWLKKIFTGAAYAAPIIDMFLPGLGVVIRTVTNAIIVAEKNLGEKKGVEKMAVVMDCLSVAAPSMVSGIEKATGKELADEQLFEDGLKCVAEGIVKLLNAFRLLPKGGNPAL